jgi:hypothetical protein
MTAVLQLIHESKVKGVFHLRKSWKVFESIDKDVAVRGGGDIDPELKRCVEFGIGLFNWATSAVPHSLLKFTEMAGFKSDRELGLACLRASHNAGGGEFCDNTHTVTL